MKLQPYTLQPATGKHFYNRQRLLETIVHLKTRVKAAGHCAVDESDMCHVLLLTALLSGYCAIGRRIFNSLEQDSYFSPLLPRVKCVSQLIHYG